MGSSDVVAFIFILIIVAGFMFCILICCLGIKQMCKKQHRPVYHRAAYVTDSVYTPNPRPVITNLSGPILESHPGNQMRVPQQSPSAPHQSSNQPQPFMPYPRYNSSVMQDFYRERTSSDPYARLQSQPQVHQWPQRPLSLQNFNQFPAIGPHYCPYPVQNPTQPFSINSDSIGFGQQASVSLQSIGWNTGSNGPHSCSQGMAVPMKNIGFFN